MKRHSTFNQILLAVFLMGNSFISFAQRDSLTIVNSGKSLFQTNCSPCHQVHRESNGPMLASINQKKPEAWLLAFIKDSQQIILTGDTYANFLFEQYNHTVMPSFRHLSDSEIKDILRYIRAVSVDVHQGGIPEGEIREELVTENVLKGKKLFQNQCATCHFIGKEGFGPALGSVTKRHPTAWLVDFIHDSKKVIQSGDAYAVHLDQQFEGKEMVKMEFLKEEEILSILSYIEYASESPRVEAGQNGQKRVGENGFYSRPKTDTQAETDMGFLPKVPMIILGLVSTVVMGFLVVKLFYYLYRKPD